MAMEFNVDRGCSPEDGEQQQGVCGWWSQARSSETTMGARVLGCLKGDLLGEKETAPASFIEQAPWRWF
jgi:hypothetical protein